MATRKNFANRQLTRLKGVLGRLTKQAADPMPLPKRFQKKDLAVTKEMLLDYRTKVLAPTIVKVQLRITGLQGGIAVAGIAAAT